ncbi:hypothetical protein FHX82_005270 [Amycolatopsis bartoniae]|uniref:Uncharacterized protein n=1 Tax=Amycolatopsis bartoniae TaxID=941986 RepID=A0A8H9M8B2_9PSEU|nr:hypothetical protein [Amycolatopsis bartoniae]MBB2938194.1 hypothetical protein [Amycolatopsis bartoniae]TVT03205.1 hypothetical protein FNH07_25755 [Amycolatopsis bartoniae]GHF33344.1 hypothetical protein GCM10017566_02470 [Amycolatopsis bartoniae]
MGFRRGGRETAAARRLRLVTLLELVRRAVELQDDADEVIAACGLPGEPPVSVARRGRQVGAEYARLQGWVLDLCEDDEPGTLARRIGELLSYHTEMLDLSLKLAFPRYRSPRLERRRQELTGLGEPARTLRETEAALRLWLDSTP